MPEGESGVMSGGGAGHYWSHNIPTRDTVGIQHSEKTHNIKHEQQRILTSGSCQGRVWRWSVLPSPHQLYCLLVSEMTNIGPH